MMERCAIIDGAAGIWALTAKDADRAVLARGLAGLGGTGTSDANRGARLPIIGGYCQAFGLK
jgi:hypothetical protein